MMNLHAPLLYGDDTSNIPNTDIYTYSIQQESIQIKLFQSTKVFGIRFQKC